MLSVSSLTLRPAGETLETFRHFPRGLRCPKVIREVLRGRGDRHHLDRVGIARFRDSRQLSLIVILFALRPIAFQRQAQTISDAIDVSIVGCDLRDIQDRPIAEPTGAQTTQVAFGHFPGRARQLGGIIEHRPVWRRQLGVLIIPLDLGGPLAVSSQLTEVARMMFQSVFAAVDGGDDDADQLALRPRQGRVAKHQRLVEMQVINEGSRVQAVDLHDVIDLSALGVSRPLIGAFQFASRVGFGHGFNPGD